MGKKHRRQGKGAGGPRRADEYEHLRTCEACTMAAGENREDECSTVMHFENAAGQVAGVRVIHGGGCEVCSGHDTVEGDGHRSADGAGRALSIALCPAHERDLASGRLTMDLDDLGRDIDRLLLGRAGAVPPTEDEIEQTQDDVERVCERARAGAEPGFELSVSRQLRLDRFLLWSVTLDEQGDISARYLKDIARRLGARCPDTTGLIAEVRLMTHRETHLQQWQVEVLEGDEPIGVLYADTSTMSDGGEGYLAVIEDSLGAA